MTKISKQNSIKNNWPVRPNHLVPVPGKQFLLGHLEPNAYVRFNSKYAYEHETEDPQTAKLPPLEKALVNIKEARRLFTELQDKYGIEHAGFYPAIVETKDKGIGNMVVSTDIVGWQRSDEAIPPEELPAARQLFGKLTTYMIDKNRSGENQLSDIASISQYIYQPEKDEFVLADTDPYFDSDIETRQTFYLDLQAWGQTILSPDEFKEWQTAVPQELHVEPVPL